MKILIIGATGFLGKAVVKECKKNHISYCAASKNGAKGVMKLDITKPFNFKKNPELNYCFDAVIHLAAKNHSKKRDKMKDYFFTNVIGTTNILEYCKEKKIKKIVFSSSFSVYGKNFSGTMSEKTKTIPESEYGTSKILAEKAIKHYKKKYGINYAIIRFPMLFGKGMDNNIVSDLINSIKNKENKVFEKDKKVVIADVDDSAKIIVQAIHKKGIFNFAQFIVSLKKISDITKKILGEKKIKCGEPTFSSKSTSDFSLNNTKISNSFNVPKNTLNKTIKKFF
jgi:nucleoside-diphosphate-sugar epimerase